MEFITPELFGLLILAAFAAGFIDSIAGGGGLIAVPALLLAGASPLQALATNKLQGMFGAGSAAFTYAAKGLVNLKKQGLAALIALIASAAGAYLITIIPADDLRKFIPFILIAIALYFWFKPNLDDENRTARISPIMLTLTAVPLVAFYDGFFGPGAGSFYMLAFISLSGFGVLKATAHTKLLNFASNLGGFIVFATSGAVLWKLGLAMGIAQIMGAQLGSRLAIKKGAALIKPLLITISIIMAARLLWQNFT